MDKSSKTYIENEAQYWITKQSVYRFLESLKILNKLIKDQGENAMIKIQIDAVSQQLKDLQSQLADYENEQIRKFWL